MEKVGILVVSYGSRETAIIDLLHRSSKYKTEIYVADKQRNPFNVQRASKHVVIPDLNIDDISKFAETNKDKLDFGIVGPEKPIIDGVRDLVEKRTGIPMICPKKEFAIEESKCRQRLSFEQIVPEANPRFRIFNPKDYGNTESIKKSVFDWIEQLENKVVVKPDRPTAGKGVGVWGDHFANRDQFFEHFMSNYQYGQVIVEEKIDGEEASFQVFSDGKHIVPLPDTRDYKRAFDGDEGPNTGGMGSYKNARETLPFMTSQERQQEVQIANRIFSNWRRQTEDDTGLRGVPLYLAFMHTGKEAKILENNSRPGDPEIINILPILKEDFIDVCFKMINGNLTRLEFEEKATVVTYKVPPNYGGYSATFPDFVNKDEIGTPVNMEEAYKLTEENKNFRVYPAALELRDGKTYALRSRAVSVVGIAEDIETARQTSLEGIESIKGGALWNRTDIASEKHIRKSSLHMEELRRRN